MAAITVASILRRVLLCMQELVATKLPKVHAKMAALHCDMTIIATDWFICLFSTALPSEVGTAPTQMA